MNDKKVDPNISVRSSPIRFLEMSQNIPLSVREILSHAQQQHVTPKFLSQLYLDWELRVKLRCGMPSLVVWQQRKINHHMIDSFPLFQVLKHSPTQTCQIALS